MYQYQREAMAMINSTSTFGHQRKAQKKGFCCIVNRDSQPLAATLSPPSSPELSLVLATFSPCLCPTYNEFQVSSFFLSAITISTT